MNKIAQIEEQIANEQSNIDRRTEVLQTAVDEDQELLDTYVERYTHAVQDGLGEDELSNLEMQRNEAIRRLEQNKEIIRILNLNNGSKVYRLRKELVEEYFNRIAELEDKAKTLHRKLEPLHQNLVNGVSELIGLHRESISYMRKIDRITLTREDQEQFGVAGNSLAEGQRAIADDLRFRRIYPLAVQLDISTSRLCNKQEHGQ